MQSWIVRRLAVGSIVWLGHDSLTRFECKGYGNSKRMNRARLGLPELQSPNCMTIEHTLTSAFDDVNLPKMSCFITEPQVENAGAGKARPSRLVRIAWPGGKKEQLLRLSFFHRHWLRRNGKRRSSCREDHKEHHANAPRSNETKISHLAQMKHAARA